MAVMILQLLIVAALSLSSELEATFLLLSPVTSLLTLLSPNKRSFYQRIAKCCSELLSVKAVAKRFERRIF